jgi:cytidyltransferase-like protein
MKNVVVSGKFDDFKSSHIRILEEASKQGSLHVLLWSDNLVQTVTGAAPKLPEAERSYLIQAVRYVSGVTMVSQGDVAHALPEAGRPRPDVWVSCAHADNAARSRFCAENGIEYRVLTETDLAGFPVPPPMPSAPGRKKVLVTGCYDWFHSGHVRFLEEVAELGDLYVSIGSDANVELLKGAGHPMFKQDERRYVVGSVKYVKQCLISTGTGWLDAEPEARLIRPDIYAVNEDGDKPEKREFCRRLGIEYVVLKRLPKEGLTRRSSTDLRGF